MIHFYPHALYLYCHIQIDSISLQAVSCYSSIYIQPCHVHVTNSLLIFHSALYLYINVSGNIVCTYTFVPQPISFLWVTVWLELVTSSLVYYVGSHSTTSCHTLRHHIVVCGIILLCALSVWHHVIVCSWCMTSCHCGLSLYEIILL